MYKVLWNWKYNNILKSVASFHVGKTKPSKKQNPWVNQHVHPKICNQNRLCFTTHQNQQEWIEACWGANNTINEAKANSWQLISYTAPCQMPTVHIYGRLFKSSRIWKIIQGVNGTPDTNSPSEAMSYNGRTIPHA